MVSFFRWTFRALVVGAILGVALAFAPGCALTDMTGETYAWTVEESQAALGADNRRELGPVFSNAGGNVPGERNASEVAISVEAETEDPPENQTLWEVLAEFWSSPPVLVLRVAATIAGFVI